MVPQSSAKDQFHSPSYFITLNPIFVAQRVTKNLKRNVEDRVGSQNKLTGGLSAFDQKIVSGQLKTTEF